MELTLKVNQNTGFKAKVLFILYTLAFSSCSTLKDTESVEDREKKVYEHQLGIIINHLNVGEPEKAHFELRPLIADYPDKPELQNLMGLSYMGLKQAQMAEKYFRKAFDMNADPAFALNITSALIEQKRYKTAIAMLKQFKPSDLKNYSYPERFDHNIGLAFERINKKRLAVKYYRKALSKNPSNYQTLMQLGRLLQAAKKNKTAEPIFKRAADICLRCYEPVKRRSDLLVALGRKAEATRILLDYIEVQDIRPQDMGMARQYLSKLEPNFLRPKKNGKNN